MTLSSKNSKIVKATALNVRFKVIKSVIFFDLLPMLAEGSFFGSFFGCRCHVVEPGEEAAGLGCDDGYRKSPSEMMEDETLFRIRDRAALKQREVLSFCGG